MLLFVFLNPNYILLRGFFERIFIGILFKTVNYCFDNDFDNIFIYYDKNGMLFYDRHGIIFYDLNAT
jgi:hypothetical protein